jgi:hypothetical protein
MVVAITMRAETSLVYGMELAYPASKAESGRPPTRLDIEEVKRRSLISTQFFSMFCHQLRMHGYGGFISCPLNSAV